MRQTAADGTITGINYLKGDLALCIEKLQKHAQLLT